MQQFLSMRFLYSSRLEIAGKCRAAPLCKVGTISRIAAVYACIRPTLEIASEESLSQSTLMRETSSRGHDSTRPCAKRNARSYDERRFDRPTPFIRFLYTRRGTIGHLLSAPPSNSARGRSVKVVLRASLVRAACGTLVQYKIVTYAREHANYPRNATANFFYSFRDGDMAGHSFLYRNLFAWQKHAFCSSCVEIIG